MLRVFPFCFVVAALMMLAGMSASVPKTEKAPNDGFPLLSDVPERPAQMNRNARENMRDYRVQVEELEAEHRDMLEHFERLPRNAEQGGE